MILRIGVNFWGKVDGLSCGKLLRWGSIQVKGDTIHISQSQAAAAIYTHVIMVYNTHVPIQIEPYSVVT